MNFSRSIRTGVLAWGSLFLGAQAFASALPSDLAQLLGRWEAIEKGAEAKDLWQIEAVSLSPEELNDGTVLTGELERVQAEGPVAQFTYETLSGESRAAALKHIVPGAGMPSELCRAFAYKSYTPPADKNMTDEEKADAAAKAELAQCRKHIKDIFGGIFHASPMLLVATSQVGHGEAVHRYATIFVESLVSPSNFLRYRMRIL